MIRADDPSGENLPDRVSSKFDPWRSISPTPVASEANTSPHSDVMAPLGRVCLPEGG
jgi:hypothetical protein